MAVWKWLRFGVEKRGDFGNFNDGDTLGFMEVLYGILPLLRVTQGAALLVDNEGLYNSTDQANQVPPSHDYKLAFLIYTARSVHEAKSVDSG